MVLPRLTERSAHSPSESLLIIVTRVGDTEVGGSPISNQKQALIKLGEMSFLAPLVEVEASTPCLQSLDTHRPDLGTEPRLQSGRASGQGC